MSLTRAFFNDFRPFFRMMEDPFSLTRAHVRPNFYGMGIRPFDHPLFRDRGSSMRLSPNVDLTEEGNHYILEAEMPGVKRENLNVKVEEGGRSVSIEGKVFARAVDVPREVVAEAKSAETASQDTSASTHEGATPAPVANEPAISSIFTRTLHLPTQIDQAQVSAKLADGILTLRLPKLDEVDRSFRINVE